MQIDLRDYRPDQVDVFTLLRQAWEVGAAEITLIHGGERGSSAPSGSVRTNTGYFGVRIRQAIRGNASLKLWVKTSTMDCASEEWTTVKLRPNPRPTRTRIDLPRR